MAAPTKTVALINRLLPVKMLERVLYGVLSPASSLFFLGLRWIHLNPRKKRRMRQRREEEERIDQRRGKEEKRI